MAEPFPLFFMQIKLCPRFSTPSRTGMQRNLDSGSPTQTGRLRQKGVTESSQMGLGGGKAAVLCTDQPHCLPPGGHRTPALEYTDGLGKLLQSLA